MDDELRIVGVPQGEHDTRIANLAAVLIDGDQARVEPGLLHARSPVEVGVRWVESPEQVPRGKTYWIAWVTVGRDEHGRRGYRGLTVSQMLIDREAMVGYKYLAQHVNAMRAALAGQVDVDGLPREGLVALREELIQRGAALWEHAAPAFRQAFAGLEG